MISATKRKATNKRNTKNKRVPCLHFKYFSIAESLIALIFNFIPSILPFNVAFLYRISNFFNMPKSIHCCICDFYFLFALFSTLFQIDHVFLSMYFLWTKHNIRNTFEMLKGTNGKKLRNEPLISFRDVNKYQK